jgi:hypothetical protein
MLVVSRLLFPRLPAPAIHLTAGALRGSMAMIVVVVLAHNAASAIVDDRVAASGTGSACQSVALMIGHSTPRRSTEAICLRRIQEFGRIKGH